MNEQTEMESGQEAQSIEQENQREQLLAETQEYNKQLQANNKRLETEKCMLIRALRETSDLWLEHSVSYVDRELYKELQALK